MGLFSKIKKAFKKIADIVTPTKVITQFVARAVVVVMRAIAEVEGLVYNAAKSLTEAITIGPSWIKNLASKVTNVVFDALMFSSRLKLGIGLLAIGAITNNAGLRQEGRLELLTASLYFTRMMGAIPQWLIIIVMVILSWFFPFIALIILVVMVAFTMLMKWQLPKLADDPDAMIRHLFMLQKYGLLDKETSELLKIYADRLNRPDLHDDTNFGGYEGGYNFENVQLDEYINNIRDMLTKNDEEYQGEFKPGDLTVPAPVQTGTSAIPYVPLMLSAVLLVAIARLK